MITELLELLGLSAGQAGIGVMLIAGAIWARRAIIAGELVATGIRFGSVVAVTVGLGIMTGVISIDLSALFEFFGEFDTLLKSLFDFTFGSMNDFVEWVSAKLAVPLSRESRFTPILRV